MTLLLATQPASKPNQWVRLATAQTTPDGRVIVPSSLAGTPAALALTGALDLLRKGGNVDLVSVNGGNTYRVVGLI